MEEDWRYLYLYQGWNALHLFTDRDPIIRMFVERLHDNRPQPEVLFLHGAGGNGKSLLLKHLSEHCRKRLSDGDWKEIAGLKGEAFLTAYQQRPAVEEAAICTVDFGVRNAFGAPTLALECLLELRRSLGDKGLEFPLFDFAWLWYCKEKDLLDQEKLRTVFSPEGYGILFAVLELVMKHPFLQLGKEVMGAALGNRQLQEWWTLLVARHGIPRADVDRIRRMKPDEELGPRLPAMFAEDLRLALAEDGAPARVALLFDQHEAFWQDLHAQKDSSLNQADRWFTDFLGQLGAHPKVVPVVAGRLKPRWAKDDPGRGWQVRLVEVPGLTPEDARTFLRRAEVPMGPLREVLARYAEVTPGEVHPLFLGVLADVARSALTSGVALDPKGFETGIVGNLGDRIQHVLKELERYPVVDIARVISALAACRRFDRRVYEYLGDKLGFAVSAEGFHTLTRFCCVWPAAQSGYYRVHDLVRENCRLKDESVTRQAHQYLRTYYEALECEAEAIYHANHVDAAEGCALWNKAFRYNHAHGRLELCRALLEVGDGMMLPTAEDRGVLQLWGGRYLADTGRLEEATDLLMQAKQAFAEAAETGAPSHGLLIRLARTLITLGEVAAVRSDERAAEEWYSKALATVARALELKPRRPSGFHAQGLALARMGELDLSRGEEEAALRWLLAAIRSLRRVVRPNGGNSNGSNILGTVLLSLGEIHGRRRKWRQAQAAHGIAMQYFDTALEDWPYCVLFLNNKGVALKRQGQVEEEARRLSPEEADRYYCRAVTVFDTAMKLSGADSDVKTRANRCAALLGRARVHERLRKFAEADEFYAVVLSECEALLEVAAPSAQILQTWAQARLGVARRLAQTGRHVEAREALSGVAERCEAFSERSPHQYHMVRVLAGVYRSLGDLGAELGEYRAADRNYGCAVKTAHRLDSAPENKAFLAELLVVRARLQLEAGWPEEAWIQCEAVLCDAPGSGPQWEHAHGNALEVQANIRERQSRYGEATVLCREGLDAYSRVTGPIRPQADQCEATMWRLLARVLAKMGEATRAEEACLKAMERLEQSRDSGWCWRSRGHIWLQLAALQAPTFDGERAVRAYEQAVRSRSGNPLSLQYAFHRADSLRGLGDIQSVLGRWEEARSSFEAAAAVCAQALAAAPQNIPFLRTQAAALDGVGNAAVRLGERDAALTAYWSAIASLDACLQVANGDGEALLGRARVYLAVGDLLADANAGTEACHAWRLARGDAESSLAAAPEDPEARRVMQVANRRLDEWT